MKFLNYDSPFMVFMRNLVDYMTLGILWIIFCIPVFTTGAATTAALLTAEIVLHKEEGRLLKTFWKWFRKEFKEATLLWLIWFPIQLLVLTNVWLVAVNPMATWLKVLIYIATGVVFCWTQLWFGYLSKFEDRIRTVLENTFRMALGSVGRALLLGIIAALAMFAAVALFFLMPPLLVLVPGCWLIFHTAVLRKLFARYLPKPEEEAEAQELPAEAQ